MWFQAQKPEAGLQAQKPDTGLWAQLVAWHAELVRGQQEVWQEGWQAGGDGLRGEEGGKLGLGVAH